MPTPFQQAFHVLSLSSNQFVYLSGTDDRKACEDYDVTTTADVSDEEDIPKKRLKRKKTFGDDFAKGLQALYILQLDLLH